jgi:hypothetical protein
MTAETITTATGISPGTQVCKRCQKEKLLTEFHFQRDRPKPGQAASDAPRIRYRRECKECHKENMRQRRVEKVKSGGIEYLDNETSRIREFYRNNPDRLEMRRAADRAKYAALAELKARHMNEFNQLIQYYRRHEGIPDDYPH